MSRCQVWCQGWVDQSLVALMVWWQKFGEALSFGLSSSQLRVSRAACECFRGLKLVRATTVNVVHLCRTRPKTRLLLCEESWCDGTGKNYHAFGSGVYLIQNSKNKALDLHRSSYGSYVTVVVTRAQPHHSKVGTAMAWDWNPQARRGAIQLGFWGSSAVNWLNSTLWICGYWWSQLIPDPLVTRPKVLEISATSPTSSEGNIPKFNKVSIKRPHNCIEHSMPSRMALLESPAGKDVNSRESCWRISANLVAAVEVAMAQENLQDFHTKVFKAKHLCHLFSSVLIFLMSNCRGSTWKCDTASY